MLLNACALAQARSRQASPTNARRSRAAVRVNSASKRTGVRVQASLQPNQPSEGRDVSAKAVVKRGTTRCMRHDRPIARFGSLTPPSCHADEPVTVSAAESFVKVRALSLSASHTVVILPAIGTYGAAGLPCDQCIAAASNEHNSLSCKLRVV